jgi:SAM-dependent methyltransferase
MPATPAPPPSWDRVARHAMLPETTHDEVARFNFLANLNRHLATYVSPGNRTVFERHVRPQFEKQNGRAFRDRHEVRRALLGDPYYAQWSALRRNTMEMRQQAGRSIVMRQLEALADRAAALTAGSPQLRLDPTVNLPRYLSEVDHHCMPGSYHTELFDGDVSAAANYDLGLFATTGGALGALSEGGGLAVASFVRETFPDFAPKRILDLGCGLGHNAVPIARAFPDAQVIAVDTGAPMLRYGAARAIDLGVTNITFVQANAENLPFGTGSFDWIQTTMFWHETSRRAMERVFAEIWRLLAPKGLTLHVEQPQYDDGMSLVEQALRDWDAFYNNEPFWSAMHGIDLFGLMEDAGFDPIDMFKGKVAAKADPALFPPSPTGAVEDHGRAAAWEAYGAWKHRTR